MKNIRLILKSQQNFKNAKHKVFTEVNKRIQSIYFTKIYVCRTSKDLECKNEEIKCNNIINRLYPSSVLSQYHTNMKLEFVEAPVCLEFLW